MIGSALYFFQEKLLFLPKTLTQDYTYHFDYKFEEYFLNAKDGARINALFFEAENPKGTIFYLHGNAGDLQRWGNIVSYLVNWNYNVYIMDYRTYGKSLGELSETNMYADTQMCYDHLKTLTNSEDIIVFGRSLGTGLATFISANNNPQKLVLETPYLNIADVAKHRFPIFPVKRLLKYQFPSDMYIKDVSCSVAIFHGTSDLVVPYESGKKLYDLTNKANSIFITIEEGEHNNLIEFTKYKENLKSFLEQ
ncbi:MAG: alpha/beta hydrolase [bacterium]